MFDLEESKSVLDKDRNDRVMEHEVLFQRDGIT